MAGGAAVGLRGALWAAGEALHLRNSQPRAPELGSSWAAGDSVSSEQSEASDRLAQMAAKSHQRGHSLFWLSAFRVTPSTLFKGWDGFPLACFMVPSHT